MTMLSSDLPLPRLGRGKVRDIYDAGGDRVLLLTTDRISAFDVVMAEAIPMKGAVLTQISAWWFKQLADSVPHHMISADAGEIMRWLGHFQRPPICTFVTHGEPAAADALRHRIEEELHWNCRVPDYLEEQEL